MASPVYIWFNSEVYFWRSLASLCWSSICFPVVVLVYLVLSNISIIHPVTWLYESLTGLFSLQALFSVGVSGVCMLAVTWLSLKHFSVLPDIELSQLSGFLALLRWSRLPFLVVTVTSGTVSAWALSTLSGEEFHTLSYLVDRDTYSRVVLNEHHLFLVMSGALAGLGYYTAFFQRRRYYLHFQHVQRYRLPQMRSELSTLVHTSCWQALHLMKYLYVGYYLFGGFPKSWIERSFNMVEDPSGVPLNSLRGLLSLSLFCQTFTCLFCLTFAWTLSAALVRVFLTEPMTFPLLTDLQSEKDNTLVEALTCSYCPLLQHLAHLDLRGLCSHSAVRRQEVLSLSQPGGQPRVWPALSSFLVGSVANLTLSVKHHNWGWLADLGSDTQHAAGNGHTNGAVGNGNTSIHYRGHSTQSPDGNINTQVDQKPKPVSSKLNEWLKSLPLLGSLLTESVDYSSRVLFSSCQPQIWAVESLSEVAARAYTEDKYGVVQRSLPSIIATLLDLHEVLEKHLKLTSGVQRRGVASVDNPPDLLLKQKLFSTNKSAIYRLVNTYREHLYDLRLETDYVKKLQPFIDYLV